MASKYFQRVFKPDLVHGDISKLIGSSKTDAPFASGDILFDWHAVDVPRGSKKLVNATAYMVGEDGGAQANKDWWLVFAKGQADGTAPTTLGEENSVMTGCFELPSLYVGAVKFEASATGAGYVIGGAFGTMFIANAAGANGVQFPIVIEGQPGSGANVGYDKLYVAAFAGGAFDFSTGVLANYASGAPGGDTIPLIAVDTVDARKAFQPGDIVYIHDQDTALGTVSSVAETSITLTANNAVPVANNDELINATPITVTLGFEQ
tara:strand:+ start:1246 stop:2037 length:792 start_codon:yes stop_codon:yes gene_type:complete